MELFLSTLSLRRATHRLYGAFYWQRFLSTLSLRRATKTSKNKRRAIPISIHALLAESDASSSVLSLMQVEYFYPRSPCGERRSKPQKSGKAERFLSTLSLRRATKCLIAKCQLNLFLSTLSLRRATCSDGKRNPTTILFLSTLSLRRATQGIYEIGEASQTFLSTLSLRRATLLLPEVRDVLLNFYPRSPCGERPTPKPPSGSVFTFLSTLSLRRATEKDHQRQPLQHHFYPRSPCGERPGRCRVVTVFYIFLSTLSLRRATAKVHKTVGHFCAYETNFMGIASSC